LVAESANDYQQATDKFLLTGTLLFSFESYRLDESAMNTLDQLYALMKLKPDLNVEITGYTDSKGKASYNLWLSGKRATEVKNYLSRKGIANNRLVSVGAGESNFVAINTNPDGSDNPEGRKYNRRAEISLLNNIDESIIVEALQVPEHLRYEIAHTMNRDLAKTGKSAAGESLALSQTVTSAYTIQLLAMRNPVREDFFDPSEKVTRIQGEDGLYRYISGTYNSISEAKAEIGSFKKMGFSDAFIRVVPLEF
jgi:hypothetical protein